MVPNARSFSCPYREAATFQIPHNPCSPLSPVDWSCQWNSWQLDVNPTNLVMFRTHGGCQTYLLRNLYSKSEELGIKQQEHSLTATGYYEKAKVWGGCSAVLEETQSRQKHPQGSLAWVPRTLLRQFVFTRLDLLMIPGASQSLACAMLPSNSTIVWNLGKPPPT